MCGSDWVARDEPARADTRRAGSSSALGGPQRMRHTPRAASRLRPTGARVSARSQRRASRADPHEGSPMTRRPNLTPWTLIGPVLVLFVVFFAVPVLVLFASSFERIDTA